ncbi:MAG: C39 family peptidase [Oscillospiraceae bacterium]|nr:C39 family peptidase [Oscillospiraceae bacterium]
MRYQEQEKYNYCSVACLSIVYEHFGIIKSQEKLYNDMKLMQSVAANDNVTTVGILRHVLVTTNLKACLISTLDMHKLMEFISRENIKMIMLHKSKFSYDGHFTIFDKFEDNQIFGLDPAANKSYRMYPISVEDFGELWKYDWNMGNMSNLAVLISDNEQHFFKHTAVCGHTFDHIHISSDIAELILCPFCDNWRLIKDNVQEVLKDIKEAFHSLNDNDDNINKYRETT